MAAQTQVYYYKQRQSVVLLEAGAPIATRRYDIVYAKELTVAKGVDNIIEFAFINQDQKPVNITGKEITARIINYNGTETLLQKSLVPILAATGLTSLQLSIADLSSIDAQKCYYSLEIPVGLFDYPVFVDSQGGARGVLNIVNSVLPSFVPAKNVTVPSHPWPPGPNGNGVVYSTSTINTVEQDVFTIQTRYANFTGNTQLEGSILADFSFPYPITDPVSYSGYPGTISNINIVGSNTWITQTLVDPTEVFVGANVVAYSTSANSSANVTVIALGTGNGNVELSSSANLAVGDELIFSTHGYSGVIGINVGGYHPFVRMAIVNLGTEGTIPPNANIGNNYWGGDVVEVLYR